MENKAKKIGKSLFKILSVATVPALAIGVPTALYSELDTECDYYKKLTQKGCFLYKDTNVLTIIKSDGTKFIDCSNDGELDAVWILTDCEFDSESKEGRASWIQILSYDKNWKKYVDEYKTLREKYLAKIKTREDLEYFGYPIIVE